MGNFGTSVAQNDATLYARIHAKDLFKLWSMIQHKEQIISYKQYIPKIPFLG